MIQKYETSSSGIIDFTVLFSSDKKFNRFAQYLDLSGFTKHLKDHELSLTYHTNNDYSAYTITKTQELFDSGIDVSLPMLITIQIFRMKGETVNQFCFDRCGLDLVGLALLNKGIREIPVQKALLYRNRVNKGHQVLDEEYATWNDCLKRYDKVAQEH